MTLIVSSSSPSSISVSVRSSDPQAEYNDAVGEGTRIVGGRAVPVPSRSPSTSSR